MNADDPVYLVAGWREIYENSETRKLRRLRWFPASNRHDTGGYRRVISHPRGLEIYGAWILMLACASKAPIRGILASADEPFNGEDLGYQTGAPQEVFDLAFEVLSSPRVGWLRRLPFREALTEVQPAANDAAARPAISAVQPRASGDSPDISGGRPGSSGESPEVSAPKGRERKRTEENRPDPQKNGLEPNRSGGPAVGSDRGSALVLAGSDRNGNGSVAWRNLFVFAVVRALGIYPARAMAQRRPLGAVARRFQDRADRDECLARCLKIAADKRDAALDNPAAAWQAEVDRVYPPPPELGR